jgi:hypothetical protein
MKKVPYSEDWLITNQLNDFDYDSIDDNLRGDAEEITFTKAQREYLEDYLIQYRKEVAQTLLSFILKPTETLKNNSDRSRNAMLMKILCRVVLLNKILNNSDVPYKDFPAEYGISNHSYYDERNEIVKELKKLDKNISFVICNNRAK